MALTAIEQAALKVVIRSMYGVQKTRVQQGNREARLIRENIATQPIVDEMFSGVSEGLRSAEHSLYLLLGRIIRKLPIWTEFFDKVQGCNTAIAGSIIGLIGDIGKFDTVSKLLAYAGWATVCSTCFKTSCNCPGHQRNRVPMRRIKGEKLSFSPKLKQASWKAADSVFRLSYLEAVPVGSIGRGGKPLVRGRDERMPSPYRNLIDQYRDATVQKLIDGTPGNVPVIIYAKNQKKGGDWHPRFWNHEVFGDDPPVIKVPDDVKKQLRTLKKAGRLHEAEELSRQTQPPYTASRIMARGKRYAAKMILSHVFEAWRHVEGLPPVEPYVIASGAEHVAGHNRHRPWTEFLGWADHAYESRFFAREDEVEDDSPAEELVA